jgi:hypothetical protein
MIPTAEEILNKHCPVFSPLFIEPDNAAMMSMRQGILSAMKEYAKIMASLSWEASQKRSEELFRTYPPELSQLPDRESFMKTLFKEEKH